MWMVTLMHAALLAGAPVARPADPGRETPDAAAARRELAIADRAMERGELTYARSKYESVVAMERARGVFARDAMWRLASVYYALGDATRAAATMDAVADEAGKRADAATEAAALVEGSRLYQRLGRADDAVARLKRATELLGSPDLPDDVKVTLLRRIGA